MKEYINELKNNSKVEKVKFELKPSLNEELDYKSIEIILNTKRNLFDWAKSISLIPTEDQFEIEMTFPHNPVNTRLKEIYESHKTKDWTGKSKSYSTNPVINLRGNKELVKTLINYFYSTLN